MGFGFRKSFNLGPLRVNLSKSGIGASVGVKGARIGTGPRGRYVQVGMHGVYYRKTLSSGKPSLNNAPTTPNIPQIPSGNMQAIESADTKEMVDESSTDFIQELERVRKYINKTPIIIGLAIFAIFVAITAVSQQSIFFIILASVTCLSALAVLPKVIAIDREEGMLTLNYELDQTTGKLFSELQTAFKTFITSERIWNITAHGYIADQKRNAGANSELNRHFIKPDMSLPKGIESNVTIPCLPAGSETLYFFPDRLLVYTNNGIGVVPYNELTVSLNSTRFIEEERVPSDAQVIDKTWKFVNKQGGPDKRFNNNYQIPIVKYGTLHLQSRTGLNELFHFSRSNSGEMIAVAITNMATNN